MSMATDLVSAMISEATAREYQVLTILSFDSETFSSVFLHG